MFRPEYAEFGETRHYDRVSGELLCTWRTPGSPQNTCPALVRQEGRLKLIVTTASENMTAEVREKCPNAGRIFIADTDIADTSAELTQRFRA